MRQCLSAGSVSSHRPSPYQGNRIDLNLRLLPLFNVFNYCIVHQKVKSVKGRSISMQLSLSPFPSMWLSIHNYQTKDSYFFSNQLYAQPLYPIDWDFSDSLPASVHATVLVISHLLPPQHGSTQTLFLIQSCFSCLVSAGLPDASLIVFFPKGPSLAPDTTLTLAAVFVTA